MALALDPSHASACCTRSPFPEPSGLTHHRTRHSSHTTTAGPPPPPTTSSALKLYALIARETTILCEYTTTSGNFQQITSTILNKIKPEVGTRSHEGPSAWRYTTVPRRPASTFMQMSLRRRLAELS